MSVRLTYVPLALADQIPDFIATRGKTLEGSVMVRAHNCSTLSLLKMLYALRAGPLQFNDLFRRSEIRLKSSFLRYIALCYNLGFLCKDGTSYAATPRGLELLDLFIQKSN